MSKRECTRCTGTGQIVVPAFKFGAGRLPCPYCYGKGYVDPDANPPASETRPAQASDEEAAKAYYNENRHYHDSDGVDAAECFLAGAAYKEAAMRGEIEKRDARIAELEKQLVVANNYARFPKSAVEQAVAAERERIREVIGSEAGIVMRTETFSRAFNPKDPDREISGYTYYDPTEEE